MERTILFEDIRDTILRELLGADNQIFIAVAWITDMEILKVLSEKISAGIDVSIVVMDDEFNHSFFNDKTIIRTHIIFNKNCHHKYCVVDDSIALSGSYNWTFSANKRFNGENICLFRDDEAIFEFKNNFHKLVGFNKREITITDYYIEKLNEIGYNEIVSEDNINWWLNLSKQWKETFFENLTEELNEIGLKKFVEKNYTDLSYSFYEDINIEQIERFCLNPLLILVLNSSQISQIYLNYESPNLQPLLKLRFLKSIGELIIGDDEWLTSTDYDIMSRITVKHFQSWTKLPLKNRVYKFKDSETMDLAFSEVSENILSFIPSSIRELRLSGNFPNDRNQIDLKWFDRFSNLKYLKLEFFLINFYGNPIKESKVELNWCELWDVKELPENFKMSNSHIVRY